MTLTTEAPRNLMSSARFFSTFAWCCARAGTGRARIVIAAPITRVVQRRRTESGERLANIIVVSFGGTHRYGSPSRTAYRHVPYHQTCTEICEIVATFLPFRDGHGTSAV